MALKLNPNVLALIGQIASINGNRFASLTYRSKGTGELARHTIQIGFDYNSSVKKSLEILAAKKFKTSLMQEAQRELISSFATTLAAHEKDEQNPDYTKKDVYEPVEYDGKPITGIRHSNTDGSFKLFGLAVTKTTLEKGVFKKVNSKPLTIAKNKIKSKLPIGRFREFSVEPNALETAKLNGTTIEL
jgi:hypothetical protein